MYLERPDRNENILILLSFILVGILFITLSIVGFADGTAVLISRYFDNSRNKISGNPSIIINIGELMVGVSYLADSIFAFLRKMESEKYLRKSYLKLNEIIRYLRFGGFFMLMIGIIISWIV